MPLSQVRFVQIILYEKLTPRYNQNNPNTVSFIADHLDLATWADFSDYLHLCSTFASDAT